jgi:hypothetical protein
MHKKRTAPLNQDWDMIDGVGVSISQFQKLLTALKESLNSIVLQMSAIQDQIDSLAVVVLQNRRGLDLLTAEKGRLCLFLGEDCCFFANKSDTVRDIIKKDRAQQLPSSQPTDILSSLYPWLTPLAVPLIRVLWLSCFYQVLLISSKDFCRSVLLPFLGLPQGAI